MDIRAPVPGDIFTLRGFLSKRRCRNLIVSTEAMGYEPATLSTGRRVENVRNNDRVMFKDQRLADELWGLLRPHAPVVEWASAVGLNEMFRFYRYGLGQRFAEHSDGAYRRSEQEASLYTVMVYLNEGFAGGETTFRGFSIRPEVGMALIFEHRIEHAGAAVEAGTKYVLRSDLMYRTNDVADSRE